MSTILAVHDDRSSTSWLLSDSGYTDGNMVRAYPGPDKVRGRQRKS